MTLNLDSALDCAALLSALRAVDLTVPGRIQGRTTHHTETWTACRLLSTLAQADQLEFPIKIIHRDRPDFLIRMPNAAVGVEVTEAITEQYAAYCALAEWEFPDALLEPAHFHWGAPDRTVDEMRDLLRQDRLTSDGWVGDYPEQEWAHFMLNLVEAKLDKLAADGFEKFDRNWLAVYDNLPLPNIYLGDGIALLRPLLEKCWHRHPVFDTLFVEHGPVIVAITAHRSDHLLLNDVWC